MLGVKGYNIGGKTGTSEDGVNTGKYVTSFVGIADTNDPEVAIVVILYNPTGEGGHQGGAVAAPIASQVLRRSLAIFRSTKRKPKEIGVLKLFEITGLKINGISTTPATAIAKKYKKTFPDCISDSIS